MRIKHTPGPWAVRDDTAGGTFNGRSIVAPATGLVAIVEDASPYDSRLMAAAPDLLTALDDLLAYLEGYDHDYPEAAPKFDRARAAIAKARGQA